jgi:membrane protein implicated in regulation of membrane protease activity
VFTVRGIVAFLAIGGWMGLAVWDNTRNAFATLISAVVVGSAALIFAALVIKWALKLQETGNLNPQNALAKMATVYIPIHPGRSGSGRVTLELQGRFVEMDAMTDSPDTLKTGETVQVVGIQGGSTLVVKPIR